MDRLSSASRAWKALIWTLVVAGVVLAIIGVKELFNSYTPWWVHPTDAPLVPLAPVLKRLSMLWVGITVLLGAWLISIQVTYESSVQRRAMRGMAIISWAFFSMFVLAPALTHLWMEVYRPRYEIAPDTDFVTVARVIFGLGVVLLCVIYGAIIYAPSRFAIVVPFLLQSLFSGVARMLDLVGSADYASWLYKHHHTLWETGMDLQLHALWIVLLGYALMFAVEYAPYAKKFRAELKDNLVPPKNGNY